MLDHPRWDEVRLAWNLAVDQRPTVVVLAECAEDVIAVVDFARARGLRVAPQGTGHGAVPVGALDGTILLKTERMRGLAIDPVARRARVEAGVLWQEVANAAAEHGLAALAGSSHDVGVVGYSLGGGIGWLARRYGLQANSILAAELVTAEGALVRADAEIEPELYWAVRGGGGNFGVVTALEFALYPVAEIYAGALFWPAERAAEVLRAWSEWIETVPREVTSVGRLMQFPPFPQVPEGLRGKSFTIVEAAILGDPDEAARLLEPLRALGPVIDNATTIPAAGLSRVHMDPEGPVPGAGDGGLLTALSPEAIDALLAVAGPESGSPLVSVELRHLGGALADAPAEPGALAKLEGEFAFYAAGMAPTPDAAAAASAHAARVREALAPWASARTYSNFTERRIGADDLFPEETVRRLRELRAQVDPDEIFRAAHPIAP